MVPIWLMYFSDMLENIAEKHKILFISFVTVLACKNTPLKLSYAQLYLIFMLKPIKLRENHIQRNKTPMPWVWRG